MGRHINRHSTYVSVDINTQLICRSTYRPTLSRYHDRDMSVDVSSDVSTEISAKSRSTYRPTQLMYRSSVGRHIDLHIGRASVNMSAATWLICWSICWSQLTPSQYANHWLSAEYWSTFSGTSVKNWDCQCQMYKLYAFPHDPFLVNLKNFWRLHIRIMCCKFSHYQATHSS